MHILTNQSSANPKGQTQAAIWGPQVTCLSCNCCRHYRTSQIVRDRPHTMPTVQRRVVCVCVFSSPRSNRHRLASSSADQFDSTPRTLVGRHRSNARDIGKTHRNRIPSTAASGGDLYVTEWFMVNAVISRTCLPAHSIVNTSVHCTKNLTVSRVSSILTPLSPPGLSSTSTVGGTVLSVAGPTDHTNSDL
jgi:hypothetical protein